MNNDFRIEVQLRISLSKTKQGKFLPGSHIPIIRPEELFRNNPEKIIILPWNIADEIVTQLHKLKKSKTKFFVAIPKIKIL